LLASFQSKKQVFYLRRDAKTQIFPGISRELFVRIAYVVFKELLQVLASFTPRISSNFGNTNLALLRLGIFHSLSTETLFFSLATFSFIM
jgi:hypothetical protein